MESYSRHKNQIELFIGVTRHYGRNESRFVVVSKMTLRQTINQSHKNKTIRSLGDTFCPHFSAFTAPRFSVDRLNGAGSVRHFDDWGKRGGEKLGKGWAWNSCNCTKKNKFEWQYSWIMLYGHPLNKDSYYGQFYVSLDKALTFSLNSTRLIGAPINVNTCFLTN